MTLEEIKNNLVQKFNIPEDKIKIVRNRRISCEVEYPLFANIFEAIVRELKFDILCIITGLDETDKLGVIYHLAQENGTVMNLKTQVDKNNPTIKSITDYFPQADLYEREIVDLLGFKVNGLSEGNRYPLPDDWPKGECPLRKDWNVKKQET